MNASEHSIVLTRVIKASSADIYAAWTDPQKMELWLGRVWADVTIGGRYLFESPSKGADPYIYSGTYLVLEENRQVTLTFLVGKPDPAKASAYRNEFLDVRLRSITPSLTELTFINGWDGQPLEDAFLVAVRSAWADWLDRMELSIFNNSKAMRHCAV